VRGVCTRFQVLLRAVLLVPPDEDAPLATLANNTQGYQDRWLYVQTASARCPFLTGIDRMPLPMAHGEGNFVCRKDWILKGLEQSGQIVLRYVDPAGRPANSIFPYNPNGSQG